MNVRNKLFFYIILYVKMLFAKMNKEYVNEDELAKKIAFERTISFVNKLYPKENPEVALKPGQLTSQLKYGYETEMLNL